MKTMKKLFALGLLPFLTACGASFDKANGYTVSDEASADNMADWSGSYSEPTGEDESIDDPSEGDSHLKIEELDYQTPEDMPTSSFSLDSSSANYSYIRSRINNGYSIPKDSVIIEQMINYFDYPDYPTKDEGPVALYSETSACPWNSDALLSSVAVTTKKVEYDTAKGNNFVFLIDVSGSMSSSNKLPLVKKSFSLLAEQLNEKDIVSIVTYSGKVETVLSGAKGNDKDTIKKKLSALSASGSTNGGSGINIAYSLAKDYYIEGGNNQILLATDGDFNVGVSKVSDLEAMVKEKQKEGISFSCFGYGTGNYRDDVMETLALNGNGNVYYIDCESEMEKTFSGDISSVLQVVSKDSKIQLTFDAEKVSKYRLIGYENRMMTGEEFNDESKDAGEIYSNKTVVALYEIYPKGEDYDSLFDIDFRYKDPSTNEAGEIKSTAGKHIANPSNSYTFASLVAEFGLYLRDSKYKGTATVEDVKSLYDMNKSVYDEDYLKKEFRSLLDAYTNNQNKATA